MPNFHVIYFESETDYFCKGLNIQAKDLFKAVSILKKEHPTVKPINIINTLEITSRKKEEYEFNI